MKLESSVMMRVWVLEGLDAVLDVGGVYDPSLDRYDHHQKGFGEVFGHGFSTKLSSAGLVFRQFGKEIIAKELQVNEGHPDVHRLFLAVYTSFMEIKELYMKLQDSMQCWTGAMWKVGLAWYHSNVDIATDAIDNGINQYDMDQPPSYVNSTHLSSRVGKLNLDWADPDQSPKKENEAFERAMALAGSEQNIERWVLLEYRRCFRLELGSGGILTTMIHFAERLQSKATRTYMKRKGNLKMAKHTDQFCQSHG
ncbi:hypothetical protein NC653_000984 [Populus alba x Populus x berolinensis]|uniref:Uncharacterized protein n=1 Tax=Populus alba x Populus x berolinensis TaxID=444605 RepID=A0AAD6WFZ6_9ROSI|nr:hypothetical protein NC653_000984 [Populus alba x Populus x berolinensis]